MARATTLDAVLLIWQDNSSDETGAGAHQHLGQLLVQQGDGDDPHALN